MDILFFLEKIANIPHYNKEAKQLSEELHSLLSGNNCGIHDFFPQIECLAHDSEVVRI